MEITFQTKEESKRKQREQFLQLPPSQRVLSFYRMTERLKDFPSKKTWSERGFEMESIVIR